MRVDYPLNVDDDAIPADGSISTTDPSSVPTSMTFHLQHIRLAEICRSIADRLPPFFHGGSPADYDTILTLDAELQSFLDQLPVFLRLDYSPTHHPPAASALAWSCQRSLINAEVHARRIKLHHPYLWRSGAVSRTICLASARAILDAGRLLVSERAPSCAGMTRAAILSHTFVAAITLVHDAQHSAGGGDAATAQEQQQQHEAAIAEARGTLERAARRSLRGKKFLHAFEGVVERYTGAGGAADGVVVAAGGGDGAIADAAAVGVGVGGSYGGGEGELGSGGGGDLDVASWQALYADLELWDPGFA